MANVLETIESRFGELKTLLTSKQGLETKISGLESALDDFKASSGRQETEITDLKATLAAKDTELGTATTSLATANKTIAERDTKITELEAAAKTASQRASEMLAGQSIPTNQLPQTEDKPVAGDAAKARLLEEYNRLAQAGAHDKTGAKAREAAAFYQKHWKELQ